MTEYLQKVCKIGQGHQTCRYIVAGQDGITCAKLTPMSVTLELRGNTMVARGNNCEGKPPDVKLTEVPYE